MILLLDTDALIKLCAAELLEDALDQAGIESSDVRILAEAHAKVIRRGAAGLIEQYGSPAHDRMVAFVRASQEAPVGSLSEFALLKPIRGIDAGEAALTSATHGLREFIILTADKKFIRALGGATGLTDIRQRLEGRVFCLEQTVLELAEVNGLDTYLPRLADLAKTDGFFANLVEGWQTSSHAAILARLRSEIDGIRDDSGGILADYP